MEVICMENNVVRCNVERCAHNMNDMCNARFIHVVGKDANHPQETDCHTFELRTFRTSVTSMTNVNLSGAVDQIFTEDPVMNPDIKCSARKCIYNLDLRCIADAIEVNSYDSATIQQTECSTFRKR